MKKFPEPSMADSVVKKPRIDPSAFLARGALVMGNVEIGRDAGVWYYSVIRGDTELITIGDETNIQDLCIIHADFGFPCRIGRRVTVGHRVILHGCTVEDDCMIGMGSVLLNGVHLGEGSVVGAGAVLKEGTVVPPGSLIVGLPARVVRAVDEATRARIDLACRHYIAEAKRHRDGEFPVSG